MINQVHVDKRKMPIRVYLVFDDGTTSKGKGKTVSLAIHNAIEKAKKEKNMPIEKCVGCRHYNPVSGCCHPEVKTKEFTKIPLSKCYEASDGRYMDRE